MSFLSLAEASRTIPYPRWAAALHCYPATVDWDSTEPDVHRRFTVRSSTGATALGYFVDLGVIGLIMVALYAWLQTQPLAVASNTHLRDRAPGPSKRADVGLGTLRP